MIRAILRRLSWRYIAFALILPAPVALLAHAYRRAPGSATITIDASREDQTISGWEATAEAGLDEPVSHAYIPELLDHAQALGLTRLRVEVRASYEHTRDIEREFREGKITKEEWRCLRYATINDNDDARTLSPAGFQWRRLDQVIGDVVVPFKARLAKSGEKLWLNLQYVAFTNDLCSGDEYVHEDPKEYAEFALAVYTHLKEKYGLTPDTWDMMLEPDNTRLWTAERIGDAMEQTAARLQAAGFTPSFIAPSTTSSKNAVPYFEEIWSRRKVRPFLHELSYHRYDYAPNDVVAGIGQAGQQYHVDTSMLEMINAGYDRLHEDLTLGRVSAWQQYVLGFPEHDTGAHYFVIEPDKPEGQRVHLSASGHYLRQYFQAIRPGAKRIAATSDATAYQAVAVRDRRGPLAVVVKADRPGEITLRQLPAGQYQVSCWTDVSRSEDAGDRCARTATVGADGTLIASVPGIGVLSVVGEGIGGGR
jgi:hypothetical protein